MRFSDRIRLPAASKNETAPVFSCTSTFTALVRREIFSADGATVHLRLLLFTGMVTRLCMKGISFPGDTVTLMIWLETGTILTAWEVPVCKASVNTTTPSFTLVKRAGCADAKRKTNNKQMHQ